MDELTIEAKPLIRALRVLVKVAQKKCPIDACRLVDGFSVGDVTLLRATDLDGKASLCVPSKGDIGAFAFDPFEVSALMKLPANKGKPVTFRAESPYPLRVRFGDSDLLRDVGPYEETVRDMHAFLDGMGNVGDAWAVHTTVAAWRDALDRVTYAMSKEETRYYLCGVHVDPGRDPLRLVATDGHALAMSAVDGARLVGERSKRGPVIPRAWASTIVRALEGVEGDMTATFTDRSVAVAAPGLSTWCRLVDGTFPDYRRIVPPPCDRKATFNPYGVSAAVKWLVADATKEEMRMTQTVTLALDAEGVGVAYSLRPERIVRVAAVPPAAPLTVGFHAGRLTAMLDRFPVGARVAMSWYDGNSPVRFDDADRPDDAHVLSPTRLKNDSTEAEKEIAA